jgi:hypothetical protein
VVSTSNNAKKKEEKSLDTYAPLVHGVLPGLEAFDDLIGWQSFRHPSIGAT